MHTIFSPCRTTPAPFPTVCYCSAAHQAVDAKYHGLVCKLLASIAAAEAVDLTQEEEAGIISEFSATAKVGGAAMQEAHAQYIMGRTLATICGCLAGALIKCWLAGAVIQG